jgi:hypothetical protein
LLVVSAAILAAAALLFVVEPMAAKLVLPRLGGAPAVWNGCMLFFQLALLAGYLYAHLLSTRFSPRIQVTLHAALLLVACVALPLGLPGGLGDPGARPPLLWLLAFLTLAIGLPFVVLAATGPLVQRWFSSTNHPHAKDPYFLYAASNVGSLAGLLLYPFVVEPALPLLTPGGSLARLHLLPWSQSTLWTVSYLAVGVLVIGSGIAMLRRPAEIPIAPVEPEAVASVPRFERLRWLALAAIPASLVLGATQFITTDVAVVPMFWVVPLAAYLLSFALAFSRTTLLPERFWGIALAILATGVALTFWVSTPPYARWLLSLHPVVVFTAGMACHRRLAALAPPPFRLTEFYLWIAAGGVLGGAFNAIAAPVIFPDIMEYPLAIVAACLATPPVSRGNDRRARILDFAGPAALAAIAIALPLMFGNAGPAETQPVRLTLALIPCLLALTFVRRPLRFALALAVLFAIGWKQSWIEGTVIYRDRTFFGMLHVIEHDGPTVLLPGAAGRVQPRMRCRSFVHGTTRHGTQGLSEELRRVPTSYFHRTNPIGQLFAAYGAQGLLNNIAVIGLGVGTLAAYGEPGRSMHFYEIDPEIVRLARDPSMFTFLQDSRANLSFTIGDGRLEIAKAPDGSFGLIVLDAFSSDAVPVHLLTREAIALYLRKLRPGGVLAFNITNANLDLSPILDALTADGGLAGLIQEGRIENQEQLLEGKDPSKWAVIAKDRAALAPLEYDARWRSLPSQPGRTPDPRYVWTDDFSSLFTVVKKAAPAVRLGG